MPFCGSTTVSSALASLEAQRAAIRSCIEANAACMALHPDSRETRVYLAQQNASLWYEYARVIGAIREVRAGWSGAAAMMGRNGRGPLIDNIINASARHREAVELGKAA